MTFREVENLEKRQAYYKKHVIILYAFICGRKRGENND